MERVYDEELLASVASQDVREVWAKDQSYGQSWKRRGGIGAFMMLARKWDRLEQFVLKVGYDVFQSITNTGGSGADGTTIAEIRDLRRYLLLVEAEMIARGAVPEPARYELGRRHVQIDGPRGFDARLDVVGHVQEAGGPHGKHL